MNALIKEIEHFMREAMEFLQDIFSLIGRVMISGMFLWGAYEKIQYWQQSLTYLKGKNVPQTQIILPILVGLKIVGGLSVFTGWHAHIGALLLLIVAIGSTLKLHDFWNLSGTDRQIEKMVFVKEIAIIGGLFMILAMGAGHFGIDS